MSVVEILDGFLKAQRVDVASLVPIDEDLQLVTTNDDYTLVNAYIVYDPAHPQGEPRDLKELLETTVPDPSRTDMIVADAMSGSVPRVTVAVRGCVRRVVTISQFLDGFLRPESVCDELTGASGRNAELLNSEDFVEPWAQVPGLGRTHAIRHLFNGWAKATTPRLCIVLAPAGHGKSKITHILAKRIAQHYAQGEDAVRPPLPILISFGQYRRSTSFAGLILEALDRFGNNRLTIEAFQFLISLGRVLFILDGYDEMVEASPDTARDNITNFVQQAGPESRILLTSRSTFYRTASDVVGQVADPLLPESDVEVIDLLPFDRAQARTYLRKRFGDGPDPSRSLERAQQVLDNDYDLEVLGSPIFLAEFANLIASEQFSISDIRRRGSLQFLVGRAFQRERARQEHDFTDEQQQLFLEGIAFDLLRFGGAGYDREELELFVAEAVEDDLARTYWEKLASHHFLLPDDRGGTAVVTMRHQVWRDYFQGSALARLLRERNSWADELLTSRDLPEGVLRTAAGLLNEETRGRLVDQAAEGGDKLVRNVVQMWLTRREPVAAARTALPAEYRRLLGGRDLSGKSFTSIAFGDTDLGRANLAGCYFENCDLSGVRFDETILDRTTLRDCVVSAGVSAATVASVTIDGEQLFGPQLRVRYATVVDAGDDQAAADDFGHWVEQVLKDRLRKFVKSRMGENNVAIDEAISWTAFMGGTDPRDRDFVVRRLYRAMRLEGVVYEGRMNSSGRPVVCLSDDPEVQAEVLAFVRSGQPGPAVERLMARLLQRAGQ
ncbi:NACHT domain-containing protein [Catellatospora sp. NPDC049609]|uniref:NACHT domain-containing protein n=1 Tax=Catellatospora sp. NPDC049609 TaxID=3155505 RepID=UPI003433986B